MSFRTRLTSFFILIVVIPMVTVGFLIFVLIGNSQRAKSDARANGLATAARSIYIEQSDAAGRDAQTLARLLANSSIASLKLRVTLLAGQLGLARVAVSLGSRPVADVGDRTALAPGEATLTSGPSKPVLTITVSEFTAPEYIRDLTGPGVVAVVRQGGRTLASTFPIRGREPRRSVGRATEP